MMTTEEKKEILDMWADAENKWQEKDARESMYKMFLPLTDEVLLDIKQSVEKLGFVTKIKD
jgi:hypothetical protein